MFFPLFASLSRRNQDILEEAFLPTLTAITEAPITSPIGDIDADEVAKFLISITRDSMMQNKEPQV